MRNRIIAAVSVLFLLGSFSAYSQEAGIKGGVNFSNLYVNDVNDENMKLGFNAGLYYKAEVSEAFAIQPEFLYSRKGSQITYGASNGVTNLTEGDYRFNLGYLDVPVGFNVYPGDNFYIQAGPYVSLLLHSNVKRVEGDDRVTVRDFERDQFNTFDYGVFAGLGFEFLEGGGLGARYNYGLQEIGQAGSFTGQATTNSKNSVWQIYVSLPFQ